jgi:spore maturation protein CgeB
VLGRLEREFGARKAAALYCCVDEEGYFPTGEDPCWDLGYLGTYTPDRQPALERLLVEPARQLPAGRFVVAGPQYPDQIDWPSNVERIDHLPPAEHLSFYNRQRFTLNVTRADMVAAGWSPSVRLFEAAACGTPILSDEWPGLTEIFDAPDSIAIVRNAGDVVRLLSETKEADRQSMARSARETVLASHTGRARARELVEAIRAAPAAVMPARHASVDFQVIEGGRL